MKLGYGFKGINGTKFVPIASAELAEAFLRAFIDQGLSVAYAFIVGENGTAYDLNFKEVA